jgi:hypothetical protein
MPDANSDNVTSIESKRPAPTCRFTIQATLRGFPITIEGEGRAADLKTIVDRLLDAGAEPPAAQAQTPTSPEATKKAAPKCPDHGTPMKASRKPGSFFCPRRGDDGDFCPHKA